MHGAAEFPKYYKERLIEMRSEQEKKTSQKSVKMTQQEAEIIQQKANEKGVSFGRYMVDSAVKGDSNGNNPELMVEITDIANMAVEIAKQKNRRGMAELRRRIGLLWSRL